MDKWLKWVTDLQAIGQIGLAYTKDPFDLERFRQIRTISTEMLSELTQLPLEVLLTIAKQETGYTTPKMEVRAAVFKNDKILLVQEKADGLWSLPGGWGDINCTPSESAKREVLEETGYIVRVIKLAALFDKQKHPHPASVPHTYKAFFLCELVGGHPTVSIETTAIDFFAQDALPPLSAPRITKEQIARMFLHYANREHPTEFD